MEKLMAEAFDAKKKINKQWTNTLEFELVINLLLNGIFPLGENDKNTKDQI